MSSILNKQELTEVLALLFNQLQEKGMLPPSIQNKETLIDSVASTMDDAFEISKDELRNPAVQKSLCLSLISEVIHGHNPHFRLDYVSLFKEKTNPLEMKNELTAQLTLLLTLNNQLNPRNQLTPLAIKQVAEEISDELTNEFMRSNKKSPAESDHITDVLAETFSASLRSLFGGIDPRITGGQIMPVLTIVGNLAGIVDLGGDNKQTSSSFIAERNRFDGHADPQGIENSVRVRLSAITDQLETSLNQMGALDHTNANWPPKPHPDQH